MLAYINGTYRPLDGMIFDADGTLLDSLPEWNAAAEDFMKKYNLRNEEIKKLFFTEPVSEIVRRAREKFQISLPYAEAKILSYIGKAYRYKINLMPNTVNMLKYFKVNGVKTAVATASEKEHIIQAFERLHIMRYFDTIVTCSELNTTKSEPDIYEYVCKKIGTDKQKTAVMEDSAVGIASAKRAGFITVGIRCASAGGAYPADWYINDASEWYLNERMMNL